ncbi:MAG: hypothetical protein QW768_04340 [Thermoproteota archaeon]
MSNKSYLKVAATAITLALLVASMFAIFPTFFTKAAVPTTYTTTVLNLSNQTALTGLPSSAGVRVYLWNYTNTSNPVQIAYADVGANGQVTFSGLPTYVWNTSKYAISANLTWNGADEGVLLLPQTMIYNGKGATPGLYPLATLLSNSSSPILVLARTLVVIQSERKIQITILLLFNFLILHFKFLTKVTILQQVPVFKLF